MHFYQLSLHQWAAFSTRRMEPSDWAEWALGHTQSEAEPLCKPELSDVPPMLRRRLSGMGKAALWCAGRVLAATDARPETTIFCSRHGEVSRTVSLLRDLAGQSPLSPASFSLSVHNAIGGIHSIARGETGPITAVSAGADSLFSALLEAWSQLRYRQQPGQTSGQALCVIYDDPLPDVVADPGDTVNEVQALALLVSCSGPEVPGGPPAANNESALELEFGFEAGASAIPVAATDEFLRFLLDPLRRSLRYYGEERAWHFRKRSDDRPGACD